MKKATIRSTMDIRRAHDEVISFSPESCSVRIVRQRSSRQCIKDNGRKERDSYHRDLALHRHVLGKKSVSLNSTFA